MDIDKDMRPKIALSLGAVALLVAVFVGIGVTYGGAGLSAAGGYALIGALIGFVLLMGVVGAYLSSRE
ncbi:hypothetical protein [Halolamina sp.]|jgi:uncharacterized membrane protein|uniref:DUF7472 family protein n=1 Tax=Halolamina sp. TaxID=1940283 RepID=UPI000223BB57|nr:hypothetical protein Halar_2998 [halophilic archaeon DL31]